MKKEGCFPVRLKVEFKISKEFLEINFSGPSKTKNSSLEV